MPMIFQLFRTSLFLLIVIFLTGCASILNGRQQQLNITANDPQATIYIDGEKTLGSTDYAYVSRDGQTHQVKVELDGYKPEYYALYQEKRSPLYIMSWIPFGVLYLLPPLFDNGPKGFNFNQEYQFDIHRPIAKRDEDEKYIFLNNTAIDVQNGDLTFSMLSLDNYKKGNRDRAYSYNSLEDDIQVSNSIFADILNGYLEEHDYADTTESIFKSRTTTLYISSTITEIDVTQVHGARWCNFIESKVTMTWELQDIYKQELYSTKIVAKSGQISWDVNAEPVQKSIEDAVTNALLTFLEDPGVAAFKPLNREEATKEEELFVLEKPKSNVNSLESALASTFTIVSAEGHGSGFLISSDGYLLTNFHVVAGATELEAQSNTGEKYPIEIVRANEEQDIALLKIDYESEFAFVLPTERKFRIGDDLYSIGTPSSIELGNTLAKGIVSSIRTIDNISYLQTDVSISPGNSGGPLVTRNGELLGIINSKLIGFGVEGIAFGTPSELILGILNLSY